MNMMIRTGLLAFGMLAMTGCVSSGGTDRDVANVEASRYNTQAAAEYYRKGQVDVALEKIEKAIEQDDENADAYMLYGMILAASVEKEDLYKARDAYEEALDLRPEDQMIRNNFASFLCDRGEHRKAIGYFIEVANSRSYNRPEAAWTNAGTCASRIPDLELAEEYLRKALAINSNHPAALWQMAQLMLEKEQPLLARAFLQRLEGMGQLPASALWLGVRIERALDDDAAANRYTDILLRDYPESREAAKAMEALKGGGDE